jgi:hypothetical protein
MRAGAHAFDEAREDPVVHDIVSSLNGVPLAFSRYASLIRIERVHREIRGTPLPVAAGRYASCLAAVLGNWKFDQAVLDLFI